VDVTVLLFWHATEFNLFVHIPLMFVRVVFGLDDDGPAGRENTAMDVELFGFEEIAPEDGDNSQVLAIWQVYNVWTRWHAGVLELACA
jgi:hypothetical protein